MKDERGHGSDSQGNRAQMGQEPAAHQVLIQKLNMAMAGNPWQTVAKMQNRVVAERTALRMRVDNRKNELRGSSAMRVR